MSITKKAETSHLPLEDDNFRFLSELGQGSYGKVYKAIDKANQQYAAVKVDHPL